MRGRERERERDDGERERRGVGKIMLFFYAVLSVVSESESRSSYSLCTTVFHTIHWVAMHLSIICCNTLGTGSSLLFSTGPSLFCPLPILSLPILSLF